ncbi:MAG: FHA domain-containing protein, partial [Planctomycetes bacterium]|nr:FHA domain-containing protein [Planctomycetota bacterium]
MATQSTHWCKQHLLITVDGPQGRFVKAVDKPFARVGSHPNSEIVLADESIAQRSVYFHATDEGVFCVDLSATDSEGSSRRGWMESRGSITVGAYLISAQLAHSSGAPPTTRRADFQAERSAAGPYPVVAISAGGEEIARHPLSRRLTLIGRCRPSTLRLTTHSVSTTHCIAYSDAHALWIVDLLSSNGTRFHGEAVDVVALPIGESITLGRVELTRLDPSEEKGKSRQEEAANDEREEEEEKREEEEEAREKTAHGGPASQQPSATSSRPSGREIEELTAALDHQRAAFLAEQCEARRQRKQWEKEAVETEARHLQQTERIEQYFAELGVEQGELRRKEDRWRSEQDQAQEALAGERQQLATLLAELAAQQEQLKSDRRAAQQQQDALDSQRRLLESERQQSQQRHEQWLAERGT